jgi:hypothetical protein
VLVVGLTAVWALAEKVAHPSRIKRQTNPAVDFLVCAKDAILIERFTFVPSRLASLGLAILI